MNHKTSKTIATIFSGSPPRNFVDQRIVDAVRAIEGALNCEVFCLIHRPTTEGYVDEISPWLFNKILKALESLDRGTPIAMLLDSPGGDAHSAFKIARALKRHCGEFLVIIPRWAKSAATLLSLGACKIFLGEHAELGPIDVQIEDFEQERQMSALEMVQSLERLNSEAMQVTDAMMSLLVRRSRKRIDSLLPSVLKYTAEFFRPILEKVDTVSFTYHARILKIGEDYARLLLLDRIDAGKAEELAITLARGYPDHGFAIDFDEATAIGLEVEPIPEAFVQLVGPFLPTYTKASIIGFLKEIEHEKPKTQHESASMPAADGKSSEEPKTGNRGQRRTGNRGGPNGPSEDVGTTLEPQR